MRKDGDYVYSSLEGKLIEDRNGCAEVVPSKIRNTDTTYKSQSGYMQSVGRNEARKTHRCYARAYAQQLEVTVCLRGFVSHI